MNSGLSTVSVSKLPKLSAGKQTEFIFKNIGLILIVGFFLFFIALFVCFALSRIFKHADDSIEEQLKNGTIVKYSNEWNIAWFFLTFTHLFVVALVYFAIDQYVLHNISVPKGLQIMKDNQQVGSLINVNAKSVSITQNETFGTIPTTEYVFHIVLIIIMIEMNSSLVHELHEVANILSHDRDYRSEKDEALKFVKKNKNKLEKLIEPEIS